MLRALQDAGRPGTLRFVGFDSSTKLVEALAAGELDGLVLQNPFAMGEQGVRAVVSKLDGEDVAPRIDTGVVVVTRETMNDPAVQELLSPDLDKWLR